MWEECSRTSQNENFFLCIFVYGEVFLPSMTALFLEFLDILKLKSVIIRVESRILYCH